MSDCGSGHPSTGKGRALEWIKDKDGGQMGTLGSEAKACHHHHVKKQMRELHDTVANPLSTNLHCFCAPDCKMIPLGSLGERMLGIASCNAVDLGNPSDVPKNKAMSKTYLASRKYPSYKMVNF
ncbi:hypothetical protein H8959_011890 [Pygathrix nigripes]